jgi:hypothetical protein
MVTQAHMEQSSSPPVTDQQNTAMQKETKSFVEQVVMWASISYAAGFFIILLHTSRLGLPVLDLVQAVYVWIGLPLALFAYSANRLWRIFRRWIAARTADERSFLRDSLVQDDKNVAPILNLVETIAPYVVSDFLALRLLKWVLAYARTKLASKPSYGKAAINLVIRITVGIRALTTLMISIVVPAIVALILIAYVWIVYPWLPQSWGGGAPARVHVVLDVAKISPDFSRVAGLGASWNKDGPPILSSELKLLYKTADGFWLSTEGGAPFLLDKSMVLGLMYSDSGGLTRR